MNKVQLKPEIISKTEGVKRTHYFPSGLVEEERKKGSRGKAGVKRNEEWTEKNKTWRSLAECILCTFIVVALRL